MADVGNHVPQNNINGCRTVPEGAVPEGTVPEGTVPEGTVPEGTVTERAPCHGFDVTALWVYTTNHHV